MIFLSLAFVVLCFLSKKGKEVEILLLSASRLWEDMIEKNLIRWIQHSYLSVLYALKIIYIYIYV